MERNRKYAIWVLIVVLIPILTGCNFGKREINELAMVTSVGLDEGKQEGSIRITAQIVRPADARGQTGAPSGQTGEPIYSITAEGDTIFTAMRNLARISSRRIFWAHNFIIVINEKVARKGIGDIIDFFTRNHETRMETWIVVTPNNASELVSTITGLEVVPGESLDKLFRYSAIVAEAPRSNMMRLEETYLSHSTHPVLAKMALKEREVSNKKPEQFGSIKQVELSGTAVFKRDKMVGWLNPKESRALLFFIGTVESGVVAIPCPDKTDTKAQKEVSIELKHQKFNVTPQFVNGRPEFDVKLVTYADMVESGCSTPLEEMQQQLESELANELTDELNGLIRKAQQDYKVDILKLGETFNDRYPAEWKEIRNNWDEEFSSIKVNVQVEAHINSPVRKMKPTRMSKGGM